MFKYLLFDFDGTLVNTNDLIIFTLRETSKEFMGKDLSDDDLNAILGKMLEDQFKYMSKTKYKEMVAHYRKTYKIHHNEMVKEFPGVTQTLKQLKNKGCKIAIVSAKSRKGIEWGLEHFNLKQYIDTIVSTYELERGKPYPEPALKAIEILGAEKDKTLMIGDSMYDILCGKNARIKTAMVEWTILPKESLLKLEPDFCIKTPQELLEISG